MDNELTEGMNKEIEGKAKIIYKFDEKYVIQHFKDNVTAFNALKQDSPKGKGIINNKISAHFMEKLTQVGIKNHFIKLLGPRDQLVKRVKMIPIEVITRNIVAGQLAKRICLASGTKLAKTIVEFSYKKNKDDALINEDHITALSILNIDQINTIKTEALRVNSFLINELAKFDIVMPDLKMEFGICDGEIILADEISPDTCRLWNKNFKLEQKPEIMDKDLYRFELGDLMTGYLKFANRIGVKNI